MLGLFLIFCAFWLLAALLTFSANDPSINVVKSGPAEIQNQAGLFGAYVAGFLDDHFGIVALLWPCVFAVLGVVHISSRIFLHWWRWAGFFLLTVCLLVFSSSLDLSIGDLRGGGMIGAILQSLSSRFLSSFGSFLLWLFVFLAGVQLAGNFSWISLFQLLRHRIELYRAQARPAAADPAERDYVSAKALLNKVSPFIEKIQRIWADKPCTKEWIARFWPARFPKKQLPPAPAQQAPVLPESLQGVCEPPIQEATDSPDALPPADAAREPLRQPCTEAALHAPASPGPDITVVSEPPVIKAEPQPDTGPIARELGKKPDIRLFRENGVVEFPSTELLDAPQPVRELAPEDLKAKGAALMSCFNDFDVQGDLAAITPGPVVTMFEVRPAPGIRVSKIANLADDLSLALKAVAVRIQAPIPGTDTVGIEIPNEHRQQVNFRELAESADFARGAGPLTMILGKTISGAPFMADLTRMPHMLVAGATGAGKSVCLNSILVSLLYKVTPSQMRLLLVDPKRIEMAVYADLPHLIHPVVTEMDDAKTALDWAVQDMKNRYKTFERLGVRNIVAYHQKLAAFNGQPPPGLEDIGPMPYMVIVIDELADLMMTAAREVETSIVRLAQLARAAGIHMILATQRPSVDVVTGLIKANFPCRISFQVTSKHDSRTILDQVGAEHLLGRGDMLFKPSGGRLMRLHGPFLSDEEVQAVVGHWKAQQPPDYQVDFAQWGQEAAAAPAVGGDATSDALYNEARTFVLEQGRASISLLQRHLKIGFNRAARLMEQFEREGLIGPADGSKPRSVIK